MKHIVLLLLLSLLTSSVLLAKETSKKTKKRANYAAIYDEDNYYNNKMMALFSLQNNIFSQDVFHKTIATAFYEVMKNFSEQDFSNWCSSASSCKADFLDSYYMLVGDLVISQTFPLEHTKALYTNYLKSLLVSIRSEGGNLKSYARWLKKK